LYIDIISRHTGFFNASKINEMGYYYTISFFSAIAVDATRELVSSTGDALVISLDTLLASSKIICATYGSNPTLFEISDVVIEKETTVKEGR
jgi:hypothetical protein